MHPFAEHIKQRIESLRPRLMDTTRRNPLINNSISSRSAAFIRIVDEKPQSIFDKLVKQSVSMKLAPLPSLEKEPLDEKSAEFSEAFDIACQTDAEYLEVVEKIDFDNDEAAFEKQASAERDLKDRVREYLGYTPRVTESNVLKLADHARNFGIDPSFDLPDATYSAVDDRHDDDELQTLVLPKPLGARLARIQSRNNTLAEERGLNTLYLALGFLIWRDPASSAQDTPFKSPLLLLPITLEKARTPTGPEYSVSLRDDPFLNPVLEHKLRTEFGTKLSVPLDELSEIDVEKYFVQLLEDHSDAAGWRISRQAVIGVYPFQGIELYNDLDPENFDFSKFDVLSRLFSGTDSSGKEPSFETFTEEDVESEAAETLVPQIVMDADSSQYLSLIKVASGQNLAIEGPPGSGKSQTIVNLIANAISQNKKVLFVAQKGTALEVVLSRLKALNMDPLVLPLMGKKSDSQSFYESLNHRVELSDDIGGTPFNRGITTTKLKQQKESIARYIRVIESNAPGTELTVHHVLGWAIKHSEKIDGLDSRFLDISLDLEKLAVPLDLELLDRLREWGDSWEKQFEEARVSEGSIWSVLSDKKRDHRRLEGIAQTAAEAESKLVAVTNASGMDSLTKYSDYILPSVADSLAEISSAITEISVAGADCREIFTNTDDLLLSVEEYHSIFEAREKVVEVSRVGWGKLLELLDSKDAISNLLETAEAFGIENLSLVELKRIRDEKASRKANLDKIIAIKGGVESQFGLGNISLKEAKQLSVFAKSYHFLRDQNLSRAIALNGFDALRDIVDSASALIQKAKELSVDIERLPSRQELFEIHSNISGSNLFSVLSASYRRSRQQVQEILETSKFSKPTVVFCIDELLTIYKEWESSAANEVLGKFSKKGLSSEVAEVSGLVHNLLLDVQRIGLNNSDFSAKISPDLLSYFDTDSEIFSGIGFDQTWDLIREQRDKEISSIETISNIVETQGELLTTIGSIGISTPDRLSEVHSYLPKIASLVGEHKRITESLSPEVEKLFENGELSNSKAQKLALVLSLISESTDTDRQAYSSVTNDQAFEHLRSLIEKLDQARAGLKTFFEKSLDYGLDAELPETLVAASELIRKTVCEPQGATKVVQRSVLKEEIDKLGLLPVIETILSGESPSEIGSQLQTVVISFLTNQVYEKHSSLLSEFTGSRLDALREEYKSLDRKHIDGSADLLVNKAIGSASPPAGIGFGKKSSFTDMALINHQLDLTRRISPNKLVKRSIGALLELHPCWMMVPTSVASFLPREEVFDLVIIDEASQMTPEHSISALMRAKQAVVVGDTNQLPPTNFFKSTGDTEEEDEDVATIEESILELANATFAPKHRLLWHYRSRHEALIAFSNYYIYDNDLVIFPSPGGSRDAMGVELVRVKGVYQSGLNPIEASVITDAIVDFMESDTERSLGVVTMNQSQMEQIESMVLRHSEDNRKVAEYIEKWQVKDEGLQKFFVKNIENVQGDERDVIFISTVYGNDPEGKFRQGFGPINGAAGKRRLNVLFSRAKEKIATFTSIPLDKLNPGEHNEGAVLLKRWLEYSATGTIGEGLKESTRSKFGPDSPFEEHVIEQIESLGYEAVPQVGVSNYFIDIGVRHSSYTLGYVCGVECDGASYHSSKSARDRDILRQEVLERLGWDLYRIWSTDWFRDTYGERERLKSYLDAKLAAKISSDRTSVKGKEQLDLPELDSVDEAENIDDSDLDSAIEPRTVSLGSKIIVEYHDGPRAQMRSKFVVVDGSIQNSVVAGFSGLPCASPLGEEVVGANEGETVSFQVNQDTRNVTIVEILD